VKSDVGIKAIFRWIMSDHFLSWEVADEPSVAVVS